MHLECGWVWLLRCRVCKSIGFVSLRCCCQGQVDDAECGEFLHGDVASCTASAGRLCFWVWGMLLGWLTVLMEAAAALQGVFVKGSGNTLCRPGSFACEAVLYGNNCMAFSR